MPLSMPFHSKPRRRDFLMLCGSLLPAFDSKLSAQLPTGRDFTNSLGMRFALIPSGSFNMGEANTLPDELLDPLSYPERAVLAKHYPNGDPTKFAIPFDHARHGDFDERPVHAVTISRPFFFGTTQVTNAQYEQFDPSHRALRGKRGFSREDDEAVIFVSWDEARAFCEWLSKREGKPYRLPTEAEWEYAARAGTRTPFWTGNTLPASMLKNARSTDFRSASDIVPLTVGQTEPNPWGLFDVHGNVEEWTLDWYGPYKAGHQTDPVGRADGDFKVSRGGSHGTDPYYLRSANRAGILPETRSWLIGFRVVLGELPSTRPLPPPGPQRYQINVSQQKPPAASPSDAPYFQGPRRFVKIPPESHGPIFSHHNHDMAIAECPNGDLLAIWYTCEQERGRELAIAASRLRHGSAEWEPASPFWDAPDHNDHCPALWFDGQDTLYHFNGLGVAGKWSPLAIVMRTSQDSGVTWSKARLIAPEFGFRNMVGQPVVRTRTGAMLFGADTGFGSTIWVSRDGARTWSDAGGNINGIHAGIAEMMDGGLVAMGRGENIDGWMPRSVSYDLGKTWTAGPSTLPPISGGQRATMLRLKEGPLFFASFAADVNHPAPVMNRTDIRPATKIFGALSFDEGRTWPVRRVISDCLPEHGVDSIDGARVRMSVNSSEPQGYMASCQARDGVIHLITSINHYAFNVAWLKQGQPPGDGRPQAKQLAAKPQLAQRWEGTSLPGYTLPSGRRSTERSGTLNTFDIAHGFTLEAELNSGELEIYARGSALISNRYALRVNASGVFYFTAGRFEKFAEAASSGTYRLAVRDDTAVQIYRDGALLSVQPGEITISWTQSARGSYVEWTELRSLAVDPGGAYQP